MIQITFIPTKQLLISTVALMFSFLCLINKASANTEQWSYGYLHADIDSFVTSEATTLMKVQLSAKTDIWNNNSLHINVSYTGLSYDAASKALGYHEISKDFNLNPLNRALDFSESIRERSHISLEKIIGKMVIDGALGVNLISW